MSNYLRNNKRQRRHKNNNSQSPQIKSTDLSSPTIEKEIITDTGEKRKVVIKSSNTKDLSVSKVNKGQISYPALKVTGGQITEEMICDLQYPQAFYTYSEMLTNSTVATALNLKKTLLWTPLKNYKIVTGSAKNKKAKDALAFTQYCFNAMNQSWYDVVNNILSYNKWGFSVMEKVFTKIKSGKYQGKYKLEKLSPISPKSIDEWIFSEDYRQLLGLVQTTMYQSSGVRPIGRLSRTTYADRKSRKDTKSDIEIPINKVMLWSYRSEIGNPVGESPLAGAYKPWKSMEITQDYQLVGISKNLGGILHIEIPQQIFAAAEANPNGADAAYINRMCEDAANIHAGEQAYFLTASDTFDNSTNKMYSMTLKGVEGSSGVDDLSEVVAQFKRDILDVFGVGSMQSDGATSASREENSATHDLMLESDLGFIVERFNDDLIPYLLAINGFTLEQDELPKFIAGAVKKEDLEQFSKVFQRLGATGFISKHPKVIRNVMARAGIPQELLDELTDEELLEFLPEDTSRVGDGMAEGMPSGTGSNTGSRGNDSDMNSDNKADVPWFVSQQINDELFEISNGNKTIKILKEDLEDWID